MRRVDDQLAARLDDSAELVTGLATYPQLIVMLVEQGNDSRVLAACVFDMDLPAYLSGLPKCLTKITGEKCMRPQTIVVLTRDY